MEHGLMSVLAFSLPPTRRNTIGASILSTRGVNQPALSQLVARYEIIFLYYDPLTNIRSEDSTQERD